jgi:amidase
MPAAANERATSAYVAAMGDTAIDPFTPAVDLAAAVRGKQVSPVELADLYLERIDRLDPQLNAFCHRADDEVRAAAKVAADAVVAAGSATDELPPFHGVPLPIKDLNDVAGWPTTHGSAATSRAPQPANEPVVQRFVDAGFVLLGKTTTPEFGTISHTESDALGDTRNPWDLARTPGGSSGGAGAAVASGMAPIAHGSDGGGSIRIPSSCCGLVGLKPTRGRVAGSKVELEGLVTDGVLARTVADAAAGFDLLTAHDPALWFSPAPPAVPSSEAIRQAPPSGLRVGSLREAPGALTPVDPACAAAVDLVLLELGAGGHVHVDGVPDLPDPEELVVAFGTLWNTGSAYFEVEDWSRIEPLNAALRAAGQAVDSIRYTEDVVATQAISRRLVRSFVSRYDLLVTPTMACLPPPIGAWRAGMEADPMMGMFNVFPMGIFTSLFNITGLPAISVPVHVDEATGLPVGVQLVAAPWREDLLLQVAAQLEATFRWQDRRAAVV